MNRIAFLVFVIFGAATATCTSQGISTGLERFALSADQKILLEQQALDGSGDAATRLAQHYTMTPEGGGSNSGLYWAQIGAENGDPTCQYIYAAELLASKNHTSQEERRAMFWLRLSARQGNRSAKATLDYYEKSRIR